MIIYKLTAEEFAQNVGGLNEKYIGHWSDWINRNSSEEVELFCSILKSWQAFKPNTMVSKNQASDIFIEAKEIISRLNDFDIQASTWFACSQNRTILVELWDLLRDLSFRSESNSKNIREGKAGLVGISKAAMLVSNGTIGPAFDSKVRKAVGIVGEPKNGFGWINALKMISDDISEFLKRRNLKSLSECVDTSFKPIAAGRLYDMALGPR